LYDIRGMLRASFVTTQRSVWQRWAPLVRWLGTALGISYVATLIDLDEVTAAFGKMSVGALVLAIVLVAANVVAGALRWRVLLTAYGAVSRPSLARATQLYFVSFFYNNFLPGAVAGDVVRGVVTRDAFGERGATAGLAVVLVERALGLFGVFLLLAVGLAAAGSSLDTGSLAVWSAIGIGGSFALVLALPFTRRLAPVLPGPLRRIAEKVPALSSASAFAGAAALSVVTQILIALAGYVLLNAIEPRVDLGASLLIVPLAAATTFLPITVGGAGAREAVYVTLGASLFAMPRADALAASLALWLAHLIVGAAGGVLQLLQPRSASATGSR
jgi:glycosyltransferase 2 family protein